MADALTVDKVCAAQRRRVQHAVADGLFLLAHSKTHEAGSPVAGPRPHAVHQPQGRPTHRKLWRLLCCLPRPSAPPTLATIDWLTTQV